MSPRKGNECILEGCLQLPHTSWARGCGSAYCQLTIHACAMQLSFNTRPCVPTFLNLSIHTFLANHLHSPQPLLSPSSATLVHSISACYTCPVSALAP